MLDCASHEYDFRCNSCRTTGLRLITMNRLISFASVRRFYSPLRPAVLGPAAARLKDHQTSAAHSFCIRLLLFTFPRTCLAIHATMMARRTLWMGAVLICFSFRTEPAVAQNWNVTTAPSANWVSLASSADGNRLAALVQGGEAVYISTNAGADWILSSLANGGAVGTGIACSADGKILYFAGTTQIYSSTNSGANWNPTFSPLANWTAITCSADGTHLAGSSAFRRGSPSGIIISPDGGNSWNSRTPPLDAFLAVTSSADGSQLAAADLTASAIYSSVDGGNSWALHSPPLQSFTALASSADGSRLAVASQGTGSGGSIFISTNFGLNWAPTTAPVTNWVSIASSADGQTLLGAGGGSSAFGHLFLSTDSGATWHLTNSLFTHWSCLAVSADGTKLVAAENAGHIYTLHLSPVAFSPPLRIRSSGTNAVISWLVPSMDFTLQQNTVPTSSNWVNVAAAPVLNTANLHYEVTVPSSIGNSYFRLSSSSTGLSSIQIIANILHGPWQSLVVDTIFTPTFNADHTFTAAIQSPSGVITTDSGTWTLGPTLVPNSFANPQAHLSLTNTLGNDLLSGDALLLNPDQLVFLSATTTLEPISPVVNVVLSKRTP